tara:strand:- start:278984 stop:279508 length:525 start_codon:yes stop_codon:yes gene_type:complete
MVGGRLIPVQLRVGGGDFIIIVASISKGMLGTQFISSEPLLYFQITLWRSVMSGPIFFWWYRRDFARVTQGYINVSLLVSIAKRFRWFVFAITSHCLQGPLGALSGRVLDHILIQVCLIPFQRSIRVRGIFVMMKQKALFNTAGDGRARLVIITVCVSATRKFNQNRDEKCAEQ